VKNGNNDILLKVKDLEAGYGPKNVLHKVSLEIKKGNVVAILGLNGVGKSTLLNTLMGFCSTREGYIKFKGEDISNKKIFKRVKLGISLTPQDNSIFPDMTVAENIEIGGYLLKDSDEKREQLEYVYDLLPRLKERIKQKAGTLSGGERQMLSIARALMVKPDLLMMDEPSLGIMPMLVEAIFESILEIKNRGVTVLLVEQNVKMACKIINYGYLMSVGKIIFKGDARELQTKVGL